MLLAVLIAAFFQALGVDALQPATISQAPQNVTIAYNSSESTLQNAVFSCVFNGDPLPDVYWYNSTDILNNSSKFIISGAGNTTVLTVVGAYINDVGDYSCNATNNQSSVSRTANLAVQVYTRITTHPQSTAVNESTQLLMLTCNADGTPTPTFKWKKGVYVLQDTVKTKYSDGGKSITLTNITRSDNGSYMCESSNGRTAVSAAAIVTVNYIDPIEFNSSSTSVTLNETSAFFVECKTVSNPSATYSWTSPSGTVVSGSSVLSFSSVNRNQNGTYTCAATNNVGLTATKSLTLTVQYIDPIEFNSSSTSVTLNETSAFFVECKTVSNPSATYSWTSPSGTVVSGSSVLSFSSVNRNQNGTYTCAATNNVGLTATKSLTLTVQYLDIATFNTSDSVVVIEKAPLNVQCSAVSNPSATFKWLSPSGKVVSSASVLYIQAVNRGDIGAYSCHATNGAGKTRVKPLALNVLYIDKPKFNTSSKILITETRMLAVRCNVTSNPTASLAWRTLAGKIVSTTALLSFVSIHRNDTAKYVCVANNSVASTTSSELDIEVQSIDSPTFNVSVENSLVEGDSFYVNCYSVAYRIASFQWQTYSGKVVSNSSYLRFSSLSRNDSDVYVCVGSNEAGLKRSHNLTLDVRYIDMPTFNSVKNVVINESSPLHVNCSTSANPTAKYAWLTASGVSVSASAVLSFATIQRSNDNIYVCRVSNSVGKKNSGNLSITVQYLDSPVAEAKVTFRNGSSSSVNCTVDGHPKPTVSWHQGGTQLSPRDTLQWNPILKKNTGSYFCRGANALGYKESETKVTVQYPPVVTVTSSHALPYVQIGTSVTLVCVADSVPPSQVDWVWNSKTNKTGTGSVNVTLQLQRSSSNNYTCLCKNSLGTSSVVKEVIVQERPDPPPEPRVTASSSRWIFLSWKAPFNGNSKITQYTVKYGTDSANLNKEMKTSILWANASNLNPFTEYYFSITAINSLGESVAARLSHKTNSIAPPQRKDAISSPAPSQSTATMLLKKFDNTFGTINFYQVVVIKSSSSLSSSSPNELTGLQGYAANDQPYITAEFSSSVFDASDEWHFTIGDEKRTSRNTTTRRTRRSVNPGYYNAPLKAGTSYKASFKAFVNDLQFTSTDWLEFKTKEEDTGLGAAAIVGIVIGCLLPLLLVAIFAFRYIRNKNDEKDSSEEEEKRPHRPSVFKRSFMKPRLADPAQPVSKDSFEIHVNNMKANSGYGFSQEYQMVDKRYRHSYNHSTAPYNTLKNRYANIHPYDHSRVALQAEESPGSDYINANYIAGHNGNHEYIAAQGPLPETISDFWRMVWEKNCCAIVMLTNVQEKGRQKCAQYWPTSGSATFKVLVVNVLEVLEYPELVITTFNLTKVGQAAERTIKHYHFISWPDFGVPSEPSILFSLIKKVNRWRSMAPQDGPLIVHCSAGVGRTGTYIVIDTQLNRIASGKDIAIYSNVTELREQRYLMVQTEDQYAYIHSAVLEYIKSGDTEIEAHELRDYIKRKSDVDAATGSTGLMDEFVSLARDETHHTFHEASKVHNQHKNRYNNVYPYDSTRVHLSPINGVSGSDYINASHVDGYIDAATFIATQAPLERTFEDFWRMIWERDSRTIVMLSKEEEGGKVKVNVYWPKVGSIKIGLLIIELVSKEEFSDYILRVFKITNSEQGQSRCLRHYQYTSWPENAPPESAFGAIDLIGQVTKWNITVGNKPVTVHCSAGVGRTGVFIALTNLIERLKMEAMVDVYKTVRKLRQQRTAMVQTRGQYEFCYRALQEYLDSFDHYANFE